MILCYVKFQECEMRNRSGEVSRDDDSTDDEEIKDLVKNLNISGQKKTISKELGSVSPISSNQSGDEAESFARK